MQRCWQPSTRGRRARSSTSGPGIETSITQLARLVGTAVGREVTLGHIDRRDIDNIRRRVVNIEKIRRMLHWVPRTTMGEGLRETADWLLAGPGREALGTATGRARSDADPPGHES